MIATLVIVEWNVPGMLKSVLILNLIIGLSYLFYLFLYFVNDSI